MIHLLSRAAELGQLIYVECGYCRGRRYYLPEDLQKVFGNADVSALATKMKCERCGRGDNIDADVYQPVAAERAGMTIRRLVEIRVRKRPVWRDEPPVA